MLADKIIYALPREEDSQNRTGDSQKPESDSAQLTTFLQQSTSKIDFDFERYDIMNRIRNVGLGKHATCNH